MRVVFMGTPPFAVESLRALSSHHEILAVYTRPDSPSGRGRHLTSPAVKTAADSLGITVFQPDRLGVTEVERLASIDPDVICVAAYGLLLSPEVLKISRHGAVNVHASLLPRHRGAAPVERAILAGDEVTGVSIMRMEESLDTGPVALRVEIPVADHTAETLTRELAAMGASALVEVLETMETGTTTWIPQDESEATYASKITRSDVALDPSLETSQALRRIRASSRHAPARLKLCSSPAAIIRAEPTDTSLTAGEVSMGRDELLIGLSDGAIKVTGLRPENRAEMTGTAFVCGTRDDRSRTWSGLT